MGAHDPVVDSVEDPGLVRRRIQVMGEASEGLVVIGDHLFWILQPGMGEWGAGCPEAAAMFTATYLLGLLPHFSPIVICVCCDLINGFQPLALPTEGPIAPLGP